MPKGPAAEEVDFKGLTEHILNSYLSPDVKATTEVLSLLDEGVSVIGTGKQEFFTSLREFS